MYKVTIKSAEGGADSKDLVNIQFEIYDVSGKAPDFSRGMKANLR